MLGEVDREAPNCAVAMGWSPFFCTFSDYAESCMFELFLPCTIIAVVYGARPHSQHASYALSLYTPEAWLISWTFVFLPWAKFRRRMYNFIFPSTACSKIHGRPGVNISLHLNMTVSVLYSSKNKRCERNRIGIQVNASLLTLMVQ